MRTIRTLKVVDVSQNKKCTILLLQILETTRRKGESSFFKHLTGVKCVKIQMEMSILFAEPE